MKITIELSKRQAAAFKAQAKLLQIPLEEFTALHRKAMNNYIDQILGDPDRFIIPERADLYMTLDFYEYADQETAAKVSRSLLAAGQHPDGLSVTYIDKATGHLMMAKIGEFANTDAPTT